MLAKVAAADVVEFAHDDGEVGEDVGDVCLEVLAEVLVLEEECLVDADDEAVGDVGCIKNLGDVCLECGVEIVRGVEDETEVVEDANKILGGCLVELNKSGINV